MTRLALLVTLSLFQGYFCQENAGTSLSPSLVECYNNTFLTDKDNLLPSTINTLIALIRKIEDDNPSINARELSVQLLHRFRQDGIVKNERQPSTTYGIPYSPRRWESYKNRVQLTELTPTKSVTFNNNTLNATERCSLHSMISSTIELHVRGDEGTVCTSISRYTLRAKRDTELTERVGDTSSSFSSCPIEDGVVYTKWGTVKAGLLLSGIAAGFQQMYVPAPNGKKSNNLYASTIAGELSEAALYQDSDTIKIGAKGGWKNNLVFVPRYYYIQDNSKLQVTDAEIRGGLDGLYMAITIDSWKTKSSSLFSNAKVSQILEAYYSPRGLFDKNIRACNRKNLFRDLLPVGTLVEEVTNFNYLLDEKAVYSYTPNHDYFPVMAQNAVNSFTTYLNTMNDLECSAEELPVAKEVSELLIFVDTAWNVNVIQNLLSYFLSNLNVNRYGTRYTILDGVSTNALVNSSYDIAEIHARLNATEYQKHASGFDYKQVFIEIDNYFTARLNNESAINGASTIALLIPHNTPNEDEKTEINAKKTSFKGSLPDIKILVLGTGSPDGYSDVVYTANKDIFVLANDQYVDDSSMKTTVKALVSRVLEIPRSIVNPKCGSIFESETSSFDVTQFADPSGINYYRIAPNYFYNGATDNSRNLKVRGNGYGTLSVCMSRTLGNPRANTTDQPCTTITSEETSYPLEGFCDGQTTSTCAPIYISVEGITSTLRCNDALCPNPDSIKFQIVLENVGCSSASRMVIHSIFLITFVSFLIY